MAGQKTINDPYSKHTLSLTLSHRQHSHSTAPIYIPRDENYGYKLSIYIYYIC